MMNKIRSAPFHFFRKKDKKSRVCGVKKIRHACASRRVAFRRLWSAREISNEAEKGEQQRHNSPQLTLIFFNAFFFSRIFFRIFSLHARLGRTSRLSHVKRKVKSVTFVLSHESDGHARVLPFSFSYSPPRTSRFGRSWIYHYHL